MATLSGKYVLIADQIDRDILKDANPSFQGDVTCNGKPINDVYTCVIDGGISWMTFNYTDNSGDTIYSNVDNTLVNPVLQGEYVLDFGQSFYVDDDFKRFIDAAAVPLDLTAARSLQYGPIPDVCSIHVTVSGVILNDANLGKVFTYISSTPSSGATYSFATMYFGNNLIGADNVYIPAQSNDYYNNTDSGLSNPILFQVTTPEAELSPNAMFFLAKYTRPAITKTYTEAYIQEVVAAIRDLEHLPANTTSDGMQCIDLGIRLRNINNSEVYI